jgi:hypothetical protein
MEFPNTWYLPQAAAPIFSEGGLDRRGFRSEVLDGVKTFSDQKGEPWVVAN